MRTWADVVPYLGDLGAADSSLHLSDAQIAAALAVENTALGAAMVLSARHGKIVAAHDVRCRIQASPALQHIQQLAEHVRMQDAVANYRRRIAERARERQRLLADWSRLHNERVQLCELKRARNAVRCGAKTRTGTPCKRRPELGRTRCRCHGGCSTGARTPEGRVRALAALERGRDTQRLRRAASTGAAP
jgi:hypothetical protein